MILPQKSSLALLLTLVLFSSISAVENMNRTALQAELDNIAESIKLNRAFNLIHELVGDSVVSVRISERRAAFNIFGQTEIASVQVGEGSGFVIASDERGSYIVTNAHVVLRMRDNGTFFERAGRITNLVRTSTHRFTQ